jgi:hypothetical protein
MPESNLDQIVDEYLRRLREALAGMSSDRREQLVESIADHISEARSTLSANTEAAVRDILDRVGQPEVIAAAALGDQPLPKLQRSPTNRRVATVAVAGVLALGVILGIFLVTRPGHSSPPTRNATATTTTLPSITVPNVLGLSLAQAQQEFLSVRLAYAAVYGCPNTTLPPGAVVAQSPHAGARVLEASQVTLTILNPKCPKRSE